jgi:hypothetical protein
MGLGFSWAGLILGRTIGSISTTERTARKGWFLTP